ncbi:MAG TPA: hypothetical protein VFP56_12240 [Candidatus Limnocylindrales bacterium]|nr:hypothetical protein [Candidatus Limnocylindrales bacterium]
MVPGRGLAPAVLVALISFVAGCAGSPGITGSPGPTPAGTVPIAEPSTTAIGGVATPKATQPGWRVAGTVEWGGTLVAFDAGYVITGIGREVSFSPDGHDWQLVVLPWTTGTSNGAEMDARILTIGAAGRYAVAVGYADKKPCEPSSGDGGAPPCGRRPVSWVTENGIDWVASEADDIAVEAFSYQGFERIWPVDGGWDAALGQELILPDASALAHSDDGLHWRALAPVPGSATGDAPAEHVGGVGSTDGRRIIWTFDEADNMVRLWRSEGNAWTVLQDVGPEVTITASLGPSAPGQPWLIGGSQWGDDSPRLWVSADGIDFEEAALPRASETGAGIRSLVRWQGRYLALAGDGYRPAAIWSSADGEEWALEPTMTEGWPYIEQLVVAPSNLAAVLGSGPDGDDPYGRTLLLRE